MELFERPIKSVILFLLLGLISCESSQEGSSTVINLQEENYKYRKQIQNNKMLLENWFQDFSDIQEELNSINTDDIILEQYGIETPFVKPKSDKDKMVSKIYRIRQLIESQEEKLKNFDFEYDGFKNVLRSLKQQLVKKENIIASLQNENYQIKYENKLIRNENTDIKNLNQNLSASIREKSDIIRHLNEEIRLKTLKLNTKYLILVSNRQTKYFEVNSNTIRLKYKFRNIQVISFHNEASYYFTKLGRETILNISDGKFWSSSNFLVIKVKKKYL